MTEIRLIDDQAVWDSFVDGAAGHPLQLWGWGALKQKFGWRPYRVVVSENGAVLGGAQVLVRPLPWPLRALAYVPRGPVLTEAAGADWTRVLEPIVGWAKRETGAVALKVEPAVEAWQTPAGFRPASTVLYPHTAVIDLTRAEDDILHDIHSKSRQYIRKSERAGVTVTRSTSIDDLDAVLDVYDQTAERAEFHIHSPEYYRAAYELLGEHGQLYLAHLNGELASFLWLATSNGTAFELYGGMTSDGERARANYILKWTAIKACREQGIALYDLNGLLGEGISRFKRTFVQHDTDWVGTFDRPLSSLYPVWEKGLPLAKKVLKKLGR